MNQRTLFSLLTIGTFLFGCANEPEATEGATSALETSAKKLTCTVSSDDRAQPPAEFEILDKPVNSFVLPAPTNPLLDSPAVLTVMTIAERREILITLVAHNSALPQGLLVSGQGTYEGASLTWQMALKENAKKHEVRVDCRAQ